MHTSNPLLLPVLKFLVKIFTQQRYVPAQPFEELTLVADKPIVYALQTASLLDLVTLQRSCLAVGLPDPLEPIEVNGVTYSRYVAINDAKNSSARFTQLLKAHENDSELDIQLVPVKLFWDRYPGKEGKHIRHPFLPKIVKEIWKLVIKGSESLVRFSSPVSLQYMAIHHGTESRIGHKLARIARIHFSRQKMAASGPQLPNRDKMFEELLASPAMKKALNDEMKGKKCSDVKAKETALSYLEEIATDFSYRAIRMSEGILGWIWNRIYKGIEINNAESIRRLADDGHEIIYAPCHHSHMDYLLLSYVLYHQGMVPPHIAAGVNLNFWPAGPIFRHTGAFFIRRSFRGNKLYATVFREYLATLFSKGYSVEYFTEGGRTRTGRLLQPKTGMVSMTLQAMLRGMDRPVTIVPVYFGYENVMEVGTYYKELQGAKKEKESLWQVLGIFRKLRNFGHSYVNFGEPIQLNQYLDKAAPEWRQDIDPIEVQKPAWMTPVVNTLANELMTRINSAVATNALALTATSLLAAENKALTRLRLKQQLDFFLNMLRQVPYGPLISIPSESGDKLLQNALDLNKFEQTNDSLGEVVSLDPQQSILLTFYRNNILHLFILPSLVSTILSRRPGLSRAELQQHVLQFYPLLKAELFLHFNNEQLETHIDDLLNHFSSLGALAEHDNGLSLNSGYRPQFDLLAQIIQETLQRYACVLFLLIRQPDKARSELEKESQILAQRLGSLHGISAPELMDRKIFSRFVTELKNIGYLHDDTVSPELITFGSLLTSLLDSNVEQTIKDVAERN